jgi:esterase/lipase superfamily enzyme
MASPTRAHFEKPVRLSARGVVIDEYGDAVVQKSVVIKVGRLPIHTTQSDFGGGFEFENVELEAVEHYMEAKAPGYETAEQSFVVKPEMEGETLFFCLRLESRTIPRVEMLVGSDYDSAAYSHRLGHTTLAGSEDNLSRFRRVKVFFATDRRQGLKSTNDFRKAFLDGRSEDGDLKFGHCEVSIPERHRLGNLESPSLFRLEFREDTNKHVALVNFQIIERLPFFADVSATAEASENCDAFVFVHGYCVTFAEALRRTAQIAYDLGFKGAPICYSWPSKGNFLGYSADEASVEWTEPHLMDFLERLSSQKKIKTIHLLAHSMGNRALVGCLERIANSFSPGAPATFRQAILAAPDIDAGVFENKAPHAAKAAIRVTLYASSKDIPLFWSQIIHRYPRAGDTEQGIVIVPGVDSIDASSVPSGFLGHSYYGNSRTFLSDIFELVTKGTPPPRFGLRPEQLGGRPYWFFVP